MKIHTTGQFDNRATDDEWSLPLTVAVAVGAEIRGIRIGALTEASFAAIATARYWQEMIFFRDQNMAPTEREAAGNR